MAGRYYEVAVRGIAAATGAAYATIHTTANVPVSIHELGISIAAATATSVGLGRPANTPVATSSTLGQAQDSAFPASVTNVDTVWSTAPTAPTNYLRKFNLPATIGAGIIWTWPNGNGLVIPVSGWLVLWNYGASTAAAPDIYVVWEE